MTLVLNLVRHAQSADKQLGQHDHDRELTAHGEAQAKDLGIYFKENNFRFDKILCSTAVRTKQTLSLLLSEYGETPTAQIEFDAILYHGTVHDYQSKIKKTEGVPKQILIVGHNPSISHLCSLLSGHAIDLEPAGFVQLQFDDSNWSSLANNSGELQLNKR